MKKITLIIILTLGTVLWAMQSLKKENLRVSQSEKVMEAIYQAHFQIKKILLVPASCEAFIESWGQKELVLPNFLEISLSSEQSRKDVSLVSIKIKNRSGSEELMHNYAVKWEEKGNYCAGMALP